MALTAGVILLNQMLPLEFRFKENELIDSKLLKAHLKDFAKKYPKQYASNVSKIALLGEKISYYMGSNIGLEDLSIGNKKTDKKILAIEKAVNAEKDKSKKVDLMLGGFNSLVGDAKEMTKGTPGKNEIIDQISSGSRGKPEQAVRAGMSPIYAVDMNQIPKPIVIRNSFSKGLSPVEYFNVASQGRFSSVSSANATAEPGALSKVLIANVEDQKITIKDCHTSNGIKMSKKDNHIIGRYIAGSNKLITIDMFKKLSRDGGYITVRSPATCEAERGICAKCYGLRANGKMPSIGDNVGIEAGQSVGQTLTQMTLSTKHSTMGKSDGSAKLEGVAGFNALFSSKEDASGMAITSNSDGVVSSIEKSLDGTTKVVIGRKTQLIPVGKKVLVRVGSHVHAGEKITDGVESPKSVLGRHGIYSARVHEADEAHAIFKRSTGRDLQKKHFEVIARGHFSVAVDDNNNHSSYEEKMKGYPRRKVIRSVTEDIIGNYLGDNIGYIPKGTEITEKFFAKLKKWNIKRVIVTTQRPSVRPIYKSLEQRPLYNNNLFGKMNYRGIGNAIKDQIKHNNSGAISSDKSQYTAHF